MDVPMSRIFYESKIEVLPSAQINKLNDEGRHVLQVMPSNTPGYLIVEHAETKALLDNKLTRVKGD